MPHWLIWICCAAVLLIAGFVATARSRRATHHDRLAAEMAAARRAIDLAEASRDAVGTGPTPDAAAAAATYAATDA
uniref:hypothetical protein n=1 Tax=Cumulibacter manganitolerans TaxID=1884992 RepID=UPI0012962BC1